MIRNMYNNSKGKIPGGNADEFFEFLANIGVK